MRRLCALVARHRVIERALVRFQQAGRCGTADIAIQDHRNAQHPGRRDGTGHGGNLTPAKT